MWNIFSGTLQTVSASRRLQKAPRQNCYVYVLLPHTPFYIFILFFFSCFSCIYHAASDLQGFGVTRFIFMRYTMTRFFHTHPTLPGCTNTYSKHMCVVSVLYIATLVPDQLLKAQRCNTCHCISPFIKRKSAAKTFLCSLNWSSDVSLGRDEGSVHAVETACLKYLHGLKIRELFKSNRDL